MTSYNIDSAPTAESTPGYVEIIETVISSLQEDRSAMVSHVEPGYVWKFKYGSVEVFVQLAGTQEEDELMIWAAVLKLPVKNEAQLLRRLMEMNWASTFEARFAISGDQVVVCAQRTLAELSPTEVSRNITIVATIADDHDEALQAEFGQA
ncbi:MAG: YbjN domain-containing protein [Leptolyngbyaceae cyanobacterium CSU_1_4]|nr:YbjN domain-containing protein [Leptolyngbyaceae cyanobacterium CSU_1_4]